jgi:hypothetical protein
MVWYAGGSKEISTAIDQLERESDRAAAILAGSVIETLLCKALKKRFHSHTKTEKRLLHPSGPLGSFEAKIHLGLLLGLYTEPAYRELLIFKRIRNLFAHDLDLRDFSDTRVCQRCRSLTYFTNYVLTEAEHEKAIAKARAGEAMPLTGKLIGIPKVNDILADPRHRYILCAQFYSVILGHQEWGDYTPSKPHY